MSDDKQPLIAIGTWKARPTGALLGYTSKGNDQVGIGFVIAEGPSEGRSITYFGGFGEASLEFTYQALRNSGWLGDDLADLSSIEGTDARPYLVIAHEEYDGTTSARIKWVNSGGAVAMKDVMNRGDAAAFSQRMRGSIMALNQKLGSKVGGGNRKPATGATPATHAARSGGASMSDDSDIPF